VGWYRKEDEMTEEDIFLSPGTIFNKDTHYSLQQERERLSKLLIEARMEIVKLRVGIEEHHKKKLEIKRFFSEINPALAQTIPDTVDEKLYKMIREEL
jgi:hypothetical protein